MSKVKSPKKSVDLNKYNDPTDLSPKNLEIGLWIATNHKLIYKILIITLAFIAAVFLLYSSYGYIYYFVFGREQDKSLEQNVSGIDLINYRLKNTPLELIHAPARAITNNSGSDFVVHLKNSNEKQVASFSFCFVGEEKEACGSSFILPNEEKDILLINSDVKIPSGLVEFKLKDIVWQKIKTSEIPDWNAFKNQRLDFLITEPKFSDYSNNVSYLEFEITNNSSYNYFEVPLNLVISQNDNILAVNRYVIKELNSKETKKIRLSWPEAANLTGKISVTPEINILNSDVYKPYGSN